MSTWRSHAANDIADTRRTLYCTWSLATMLSIGFLALITACHAASLLLKDFRDTSIIAHMFQRSNRLKDVVWVRVSHPHTSLYFHDDGQDHRTAVSFLIEKLAEGMFDFVFDKRP